MGNRILDPKLMSKLATKLAKRKLTDVNVMVSKRASKLGVSSEAALIILAKEHGIGTSTFQRNLDPSKQAEVRGALPGIFAGDSHSSPLPKRGAAGVRAKIATSNPKTKLKAAIEYLIQDQELLDRCGDILMAKRKF